MPVLRRGDRGPAVGQYQASMARIGYNPGRVDGVFGPRTETATKTLQQDNRLPADGVAGPQTYRIVRQKEQGLASQPDVESQEEIAEVIEAGRGYIVVRTQKGNVHKRVGARNWRNNNPGNIEYGDFARRTGAVGTDGRFAVFPTLEKGTQAKEALLFNPRSRYYNLSVRDAVYRYAPPTENNTRMYLSQVLQATGARPETPMSQLTTEQRQKLVAAISRLEGFQVGSIEPVDVGTTVA